MEAFANAAIEKEMKRLGGKDIDEDEDMDEEDLEDDEQ